MIQARGVRANATGSQPMEVPSLWFLADSTNNAAIAKIVIVIAVANTASRPAARLFKIIIAINVRLRRQSLRQKRHRITQRLVSIAARGKWRVGHPGPSAVFLDRDGNVKGNVRVAVRMPKLQFV